MHFGTSPDSTMSCLENINIQCDTRDGDNNMWWVVAWWHPMALLRYYNSGLMRFSIAISLVRIEIDTRESFNEAKSRQ